jgi:hypothetical protein
LFPEVANFAQINLVYAVFYNFLQFYKFLLLFGVPRAVVPRGVVPRDWRSTRLAFHEVLFHEVSFHELSFHELP